MALVAGAALLPGYRLIIAPNPIVEDRSSSDGSYLTDVDEAVLGTGTPSWAQAFAAVSCLVAAVAIAVAGSRTVGSTGTGAGRDRRWIAAGLVCAVLVSVAGWGAAGLLRELTLARVAGNGAELEVFDPPRTNRNLVRGEDGRWTRRGLVRALPAGDVLVGVRIREVSDSADGCDAAVSAVVGLRRDDCAELWRYTVAGDHGQEWIDAMVVDPASGAVLVVVGDALVGLDVDGGIRYTHPLRPKDSLDSWTLVTGHDDHAPPANLTLGSVAALVACQGSLHDEVVGVDVATGEVLWQADRNGRRANDRRLVRFDRDGRPSASVSSFSDSDELPGLIEGPPVAIAGGDGLLALPMYRSNERAKDWAGWVLLDPTLSSTCPCPARPTTTPPTGASVATSSSSVTAPARSCSVSALPGCPSTAASRPKTAVPAETYASTATSEPCSSRATAAPAPRRPPTRHHADRLRDVGLAGPERGTRGVGQSSRPVRTMMRSSVRSFMALRMPSRPQPEPLTPP
ncbi:hypothetical protein [Actinophytocola sp.]|uniref:hypothetical protein n=1 Tax=Actinophytocola sp. TaxID=1872138 RepID=UPI003D6AB47E